MYQTFIFYSLDDQPIFAPPRPPWGKNRSPNLPNAYIIPKGRGGLCAKFGWASDSGVAAHP